MTTRRLSGHLALMLATLGMLAAASAAGRGSPQDGGKQRADRQKSEQKDSGSQSADLPREAGGRYLGNSKKGHTQTQVFRGDMIRPLVPAGASGPSAPDEGSFQLRPGDVLEIECAIPKNIESNMIFKVEDTNVVKMIPIGVRQLVPVSMVGGEPKKITGMIRGVALFQAEGEGQTTIRLDLGLRQYQYKVKVAHGQQND